MSLAKIWNFTIEQGATFRRQLTVKLAGSPLDLQYSVARLQARVKPKAATAILDISSEDGEITLNHPSTGGLYIEIAASVTKTLPIGSFVYDLELEMESGVIYRLTKGTITVDPEITKEV